MSKPTTVSFSAIKPQDRGVLVILAEEGPKPTPAGQALDRKGHEVITRAARANGFTGKKKSSLDLLVPEALGLARLVVVGAGKLEDFSEQDWVDLGGVIRGKLSGRESDEATLVVEAASDDMKVSPAQIADLALGAMLRGYRFDKYKTKKNKKDNADNGEEEQQKDLRKLVIQCPSPAAARRAFASRKAVGEGVMLARDLVNEPANELGPAEFAKRAQDLKKLGVSVEVLDKKTLRKLGMNALLSVGEGSARPSNAVVMTWRGAGQKGGKPVAIIGKGVCFDTGGISIKPAQGMEEMKGDMAGAACVVGLMHALAARKAKVNAVGLIGLVENMPSGTAQRPGDVVRSMSGQTIEVINTDAEGRLVLADLLWYAQEKVKPKWMVNLATLTGAVIVALGKEHAGLFCNDDAFCERLTAAGQAVGEKVWRLPLGPKYDELIKSDIADMKNIGGRWAGSITAAQFLQRFVKKETAWAHLDIAGTGMAASKSDINESWGPGFGVRLLNRLIAEGDEK